MAQDDDDNGDPGRENDVKPGGDAKDGAGTAADAFAAALVLKAAERDRVLRRKAAGYLETLSTLVHAQTRLVERQVEHYDDDRKTSRSAARRRHVLDWLKAAYQAAITLASFALAVIIVVMLVEAHRSQATIMNAFSSSPELANRGLTGNVVASAVLDRLQEMQSKARLLDRKNTHRVVSASAADIKIQVPQTGISIGELKRLLHSQLGHDVYIDGDLVQGNGDDITLTVRAGDVPAKTIPGKITRVRELASQAAEYIYRTERPPEYAIFLVSTNRYGDAEKYLRRAVASAGNDDDRASLANVLGNAYLNENKPKLADNEFRLAMSLKPPNWVAWANLINSLSTENEEDALKESLRFLHEANTVPKDSRPQERSYDAPALMTRDFLRASHAMLDDAAYNNGAGANASIDSPFIADTYAALHNYAKSKRYLDQSDPDNQLTQAELLLVQAYAALDQGHAQAALAPILSLQKLWKKSAELQSVDNDAPCVVGFVQGLTGRLTDSEATFAAAGRWVRCYGMHGDVLANAGDFRGAERIWAEGLRRSPGLPVVYLHRGIANMKRGELDRAEADFAQAHRTAPQFADPLKAWGDVLARKRRWSDARAKYEAALQLAPDWVQLRRARDAVAKNVAPPVEAFTHWAFE
jgi:tetratricopeptide (TPR) repeat protein